MLIGKLKPKTHNRYWTVDELTMWYGLKAKKIKNKDPIKNNAKQYQTGWGVPSTTQNYVLTWMMTSALATQTKIW